MTSEPPFSEVSEAARLSALLRYEILDTPPERAFDDIAGLAAQICGTPVAMVNMLDSDRLWVKARVGVQLDQAPRPIAFCDETIRGSVPLVVDDLSSDSRFVHNPLVNEDPYFRFYAGAPLRGAAGAAVGTVCALDYRPRTLDRDQVAALEALARQVVAQLELRLLLADARRDADSDALTGLGNRRKLTEDLAAATAAGLAEPASLLVFDLNGFKRYNDTFGHPAGDALLARLAERLRDSIAPNGRAYRIGGDEFCVLLKGSRARIDRFTIAATAALRDQGEGFAIDSSYGRVELSGEARSPERALQMADERMYARKRSGPRLSITQTRDVLLQLLQEREPELGSHMSSVGTLARGVAHQLGLDAERTEEIVRAAELHDIGKIAIPDQILHKPGPLDAEEWQFMRQHTILGERILAAAPALTQVAALVRSSHERWDGTGYPDRLAGEQIPLGARIVFACDSLNAMTTDRVYRQAMSLAAALRELSDHAGTQFDPRVASALRAQISEHPEIR